MPGIKYVVDTGTARISRYSTRSKVQRLPIERVSQASADQRAGRAGRTSPGICIRLYSQEDFESRPEFTDPEILRTSLASVLLQMSSMGVVRTPPSSWTSPSSRSPTPKRSPMRCACSRSWAHWTAEAASPPSGGSSRTCRWTRGWAA
ncbi:hypothetical protein [Nesterenkonia pannonica]|uniref:hypothetical protein n=1 Tax=Nesterenkonia pannonica TaxID=1548602 RepID=UPI0021645C51|nr:hypothetical protein [Nesterenkonia pannonica]